MWIFIVAGLFACAGNAQDAPCPIVMKPPVVVVEYKSNFSVNCAALPPTTEGMGWESTAGGTGLIKGATNVTLQIKSVQDWTLSPMCYVSFLNDTQCTANLPVIVYKMMDSVSFSMSPLPSEANPMAEGNKYHVQCDIANVAPLRKLTVYWYKGNKLLHVVTFSDSAQHPVNQSLGIDVTVDRNDNGAQIWCEAKLAFSEVGLNLPSLRAESQKLTVQYPPTFPWPANETVEVAAETELSLNCTAVGKPTPVYSWQYLQQPSQNLNESGAILTRSFHLPGTYGCTASNTQGTRTKYFIVKDPAGNPTTLVAIVAVFALLGVALLAAGPFIVAPNGTFSLNKGSYQPTPSGPV